MSVKVLDLFDVYAYLTKVSGSRDAEMPILSPINLRLEPGERMTIDLRANFKFSRPVDGTVVPDYEDPFRIWSPRPIYTTNGTVIFDFDTNSDLSIYNGTGSDFVVQRMGIITSMCNTRCMDVVVSHEYSFDSKDNVSKPIVFGDAFTAENDDERKTTATKRVKQRLTKDTVRDTPETPPVEERK